MEIERAQARFGVADPGLDGAYLRGDVDQLLIELAAVLSDRGNIGLELYLRVRRALLLGTGSLEFLLALLEGVGRSCRGLSPEKTVDNSAIESGMRTETTRPWPIVSGCRWVFPVGCIESGGALERACWRRLGAVIRVAG